jgi:hypothetical protein
MRNQATDYSNYTKQHQTSTTASESTNPGAPLPQGDALVAYEKPKQENNCEGKKIGNEMKSDMNLKVGCNVVGN